MTLSVRHKLNVHGRNITFLVRWPDSLINPQNQPKSFVDNSEDNCHAKSRMIKKCPCGANKKATIKFNQGWQRQAANLTPPA